MALSGIDAIKLGRKKFFGCTSEVTSKWCSGDSGGSSSRQQWTEASHKGGEKGKHGEKKMAR